MRFNIVTFLLLVLFATMSVAQSHNPLTITEGAAPVIDGELSAGEWEDAAVIQVPSIAGTVFVKYNGSSLYVAFQDARQYYRSSGIYIDRDLDRGVSPQPDDVWIHGSAGPFEFTGDGSSQWKQTTPSGWSYRSVSAAEYEISLEKIGISIENDTAVGILFSFLDWSTSQGEVTWPDGGYQNVADPDTWATMRLASSTSGVDRPLPYDVHLELYPNPAGSLLTIECQNNQPAELEIFRLNGQRVYSAVVWDEVKTIDVHGFPAGTYLVAISDGRSIRAGSFVKR